MTNQSSSFYKTGGTLDYNHPSYIERTADQDLYERLKQGEFCYILTSRQMGKSSLMVRTALRLRNEGESVVTIDLTSFGNTLDQEQWYDSILTRIGQQLNLETELEEFWFGHERLNPFQRWMEAIHRVVLPKCRRLILFIDEIDIVRSFKFSADEFFAGIRECYNRRAEDPEMNRLVFCLLGVLSPSELIQNADITPFNIGQRIELKDFSMHESALLAKGLNRKQPLALKLIERIIFWTGGHPYLTQSLCAAVAKDDKVRSPRTVDRLCQMLFLMSGAIEKEDNLVFVRERILQSKIDRAGLLNLYQQILDGKKIADDDANPFINVLKLAGLIKSDRGILQVRNRIYRKVFNHAWIQENMPDAELRRQKTAYRQGVIRTAVIASTAFILVGAGIYWYYYVHIQKHIEYYNAIIKRWGVAEGFHWVSERDISKRNQTYKLYRKEGKVIKYQIVNCYGEPNIFDRTEAYFANSQKNSSSDDACQIEYIYDKDGQVVYEKYFNRLGKFVGGFVYSPASTKLMGRGYYVDKDGYPKVWDKAVCVNIQRTNDGYERRILYVDRNGQLQPDRDHAYGLFYEYYSNGLTKRMTSLNAEGQPMIGEYGNAIVEYQYDNLDEWHKENNRHNQISHGNIVGKRYLDVNEKLILAKCGYAVMRSEYNPFDNNVKETCYNTKNEPTINGSGFFMRTTEYSRDLKENRYNIEYAYFNIDKKPLLLEGIFHKVENRYDQNNNFVGAIYYGINNKPVSFKMVDWEHIGTQAFSLYSFRNIGFMYENGLGVKQDYKEALLWHHKGVENGTAWSMYKMGEMYFNGHGVERDYTKAVEWFRKGAEAGDIGAMDWLGRMYQYGNGIRQNYDEAIKWYGKSAVAGNASGMNNLGWMYHSGYGVKQDYLEAIKWYRIAAETGNAWSMYEMGEMYYNGYGVKRNYAKAVEWYQEGAENDDDSAMNSLGWMYEKGYGVKQDYVLAARWYQKGVEKDNAAAMSNLGSLYYSGKGVKQDYSKAIEWYRKAVKAGSVIANSNLGWMYQNGYGVKQNYAEAITCYHKGADAGNGTAMYYLGQMYENGYGVEKSRDQAMDWYRKATDKGNKGAKERLQKLGVDSASKNTTYLVIAGEVFPDSQAEKKGVRQGDIILEYEYWSLFSEQSFDELSEELNKTIDKYKNSPKHLKILRGNQVIDYQFLPGLMGIRIVESKTSEKEVDRVRKIYEKVKGKNKKE
jgi:TPR repeat protein